MKHTPPRLPGSRSPDSLEQMKAAKALLQAGRLADAERIYQAVLSTDKDNAEAMGLLALIAVERRNFKTAKKLWRRAIRVPSPAWVFMRNLYSLLQVLLKEGLEHEAIKLADQEIPNWPAFRTPEPGERDMVLLLADVLAYLRQPGRALRLMQSLVACLPSDPGLLHTLGKLQILNGDMSSAWSTLNSADRAMQPTLSIPLMTDLYQSAKALGKREDALELRNRVATAYPTFMNPRQSGQKAEILILNSLKLTGQQSDRQLHFGGNYPTQIATALASEFHFCSILADEPDGRAAIDGLPRPDLIINNIANGESVLAEGLVATLDKFAQSLGAPVINPPDKVVLTTREASVERIAGLADVIVPRTRRFSKAGKTTDQLIAEIEAEFAYPLITRSTTSQKGAGMTRIADARELAKVLQAPVCVMRTAEEGSVGEEFLVTAFVDSRGPTGLYRKIRAAVVGNEIVIVRADFDTYWNVHGRLKDERVAFYLGRPELLAMEERICANPEAELGEQAVRGLHAIRERVPLDIFGIDFDVAADGRLVFYEANATMNLLSSARPEVRHPRHAEERLLAAIRRYFLSAAERGSLG